MFRTPIKVAPKAHRFQNLKTILERRRAELMQELQDRIRDVRSDGSTHRDVLDDAENSEVDVQDDIGFALIQLKTETLHKIGTALRRLEEGHYGDCVECGDQIAQARLQALPFAVRCRDCEESREAANRREPTMTYRDASALFAG